ncbi:MAG: DoxX family membrane protein, partial [Steroidobacteraceae bacterium]
MTTTRPGVAALAAGMIYLGVLGLANSDFAMVWQPVPSWVPWREALAYAFAATSLAAGLGLLWQRTAARASAVALGYMLLWWVLLRIPAFLASPAINAGGLGENAVTLSGALALYASLHSSDGPLGFLHGQGGIRLAKILLGAGLIGCGEAHFYFLKQTAGFIPAWIPGHTAWAIATGSGFLAAAAAILLGVSARLAAASVTAMMATFTLLIWLVDVAHSPTDRFQWTGLAVSWTLMAAAWVVTESYRDTG